MASSYVLLVTAVFIASCSGFLLDSFTGGNKTPWHLTYFDFRGRGEVSRLLFAAGKMTYTETRVSLADWPALKPTLPYHTMPTLNVSGEIYAQSLAIQAFIAKETGFYPTNHRDALMVDQIAMAREDFFGAQSKFFTQQDPVLRAEAFKVVLDNVPLFFGNFERYMNENTHKSGWVVGTKMTIGDLILYEGAQGLLQNDPTFLDPYPLQKALRSKVESQDGIKQYLATRPVTPN